jgi:hypothetical protein
VPVEWIARYNYNLGPFHSRDRSEAGLCALKLRATGERIVAKQHVTLLSNSVVPLQRAVHSSTRILSEHSSDVRSPHDLMRKLEKSTGAPALA